MHVHLPKPLHGWREFIGEVGIIVIGVGIALAAEQALEASHWRHVVAAEGDALEQEIRDNDGALVVRVLQQPCIDRRLGELAEVFRRHQAGEPLGLVGPVGRPSAFTGGETTLQMATADQSMSHMALSRKQAIFRTYGSYDLYMMVAQEERAGWRKLQSLNHRATLDTADWRELRQAYDGVVDNNISMRANLDGGHGNWLMPFAPFPQADRVALAKSLMSLPYVNQLCRPALSPARP